MLFSSKIPIYRNLHGERWVMGHNSTTIHLFTHSPTHLSSCSGQDPQEEQNGYCAVYVEKGDVHLVQAIGPDELVLGEDQGADDQKKEKINLTEIEGKIDQEQKDNREHVQPGEKRSAFDAPQQAGIENRSWSRSNSISWQE